jgi:hypothetical protein
MVAIEAETGLQRHALMKDWTFFHLRGPHAPLPVAELTPLLHRHKLPTHPEVLGRFFGPTQVIMFRI